MMYIRAMKIRALSQVIAGVALLAVLMVPAAAQARSPQQGSGAGTKVNGVADCSSGKADLCWIDVTVRQGSPLTGATCSSFSRDSGYCIGSSTGTSRWAQAGFFPKQGISTDFTWKGGTARDVDYTVNANALTVEARILGKVPSPGSATLDVTDAYSRASNVHFKTVSTGGKPGTLGGPLYIDFDYGTLNTTVHMFGYLLPK
jgi:hypothetical protein